MIVFLRLALLAVLLGSGVFLFCRGFPALPGPATGDRAPQTAPLPVPDASLRLTVLGNSLSSRGSWPEEFGTLLSECRPGGVSVRRQALAGASSRWGRTQITEALAGEDGALPPHVLIIQFSENDASLWRGLPLRLSARLHREMIAEAQAAGVTVWLATMSPAWGQNGLERPGQAAYKALYRTLADETGAGLIDTVPAWTALPRGLRRELVPDGLHPTPEGMRRITLPAFADALSPAVCGS